MSMNVTYIDHLGTDLTVVNNARVSFSKKHDAFDPVKDTKLINYLAKHGHWAPFAGPMIQVHVKAPVFIRTQCFKHKVGFAESEVSRRYVDTEPEFFMPSKWRKKAPNKKQGSLDESVDNLVISAIGLKDTSAYVAAHYETSLEVYQTLLNNGVAPEKARMVLPQAMYTEWIWTGSLAAYARFYNQRSDPHAQQEVQDLAKMISPIMENLFPVSWAALTEKTHHE